MARIHVLFFAALAEAAGERRTELDIEDGAPVERLAGLLAERYPKLGELCRNVAYAVNAEYVERSHPLRDGDEVAIIPPVSGGC